jgi:hypothetical protein
LCGSLILFDLMDTFVVKFACCFTSCQDDNYCCILTAEISGTSFLGNQNRLFSLVIKWHRQNQNGTCDANNGLNSVMLLVGMNRMRAHYERF